jgi:NAD(P)-dependent dehydrogenase (short-subunit alcohol dehydrogenase family)
MNIPAAMPTTSEPATRDLTGRIALVTGANTGIGRVTARRLAERGARVFVACRSVGRAQDVLDDIRNVGGQAEAIALDLGDLASVRRCAQDFLARGLPLHLLINNAGLAGLRGRTASGFEMAFGVNHIGHFLLTTLLLERLKASAPARIVTVASRAHTRVDGIPWDDLQRTTRTLPGIREYGVSKLANILFSAELGRRLAGTGVTTYSLHPGVIASDIWRSVPWPLRTLITRVRRMITTEEGALTTLYCATSAAVAGQTGLYYSDCRVQAPTAVAQDAALARELWARSEGWVA